MLLKDLISKLSLTVIGGQSSENIEISGIGSLQSAGGGEISFITGAKYAKQLEKTKACAVIMDYDSLRAILPPDLKFIILDSKNPYLSFAEATQIFKDASLEKSGGNGDFDGYIYRSRPVNYAGPVYNQNISVFFRDSVNNGRGFIYYSF